MTVTLGCVRAWLQCVVFPEQAVEAPQKSKSSRVVWRRFLEFKSTLWNRAILSHVMGDKMKLLLHLYSHTRTETPARTHTHAHTATEGSSHCGRIERPEKRTVCIRNAMGNNNNKKLCTKL